MPEKNGAGSTYFAGRRILARSFVREARSVGGADIEASDDARFDAGSEVVVAEDALLLQVGADFRDDGVAPESGTGTVTRKLLAAAAN